MKFRKLLVYFNAHMQRVFEYRLDFIVYSIASVISPLVGLAIWFTISSYGTLPAYKQDELVAYFLLVILINVVVFAWKGWFVQEDINKGEINKYLLKPTSFIAEYMTSAIAQKAYQTIFTLIFLFLVGKVIIGSNLLFSVPLERWLLFIISLFMAFTIDFLFDFCIGLVGFWTRDTDYIHKIYALAYNLLSGRIIPLAFMPVVLIQLGTYLPFRYMISFPAEIVLGRLTSSELILGFIMQGFWFLGSIFLYKFILNRGLRSYSAFGS